MAAHRRKRTSLDHPGTRGYKEDDSVGMMKRPLYQWLDDVTRQNKSQEIIEKYIVPILIILIIVYFLYKYARLH